MNLYHVLDENKRNNNLKFSIKFSTDFCEIDFQQHYLNHVCVVIGVIYNYHDRYQFLGLLFSMIH